MLGLKPSDVQMLIDMSRLLKSEKYSDLTLKCHERAFKVHRAVVCTRSSVFAAAIDGGFKVFAISIGDGLGKLIVRIGGNYS